MHSNTLSLGPATRRADPSDAEIVHQLYRLSPAYFEIISIPIPTLDEVRTDLATASSDPRRHTELILLPDGTASELNLSGQEPSDPVTGARVAGYLDYKLDYPEPGDATVNLLLVLPWLQSLGLGSACAKDLEERLRGRSRRLLASIYGSNPRARNFWEKLGYTFAIDARPILVWYAKLLSPAASAAAAS